MKALLLGAAISLSSAAAAAHGGDGCEHGSTQQQSQQHSQTKNYERKMTGVVIDSRGDTLFLAGSDGAIVPVQIRSSTVLDAACTNGKVDLDELFDRGDRVEVTFTVNQMKDGSVANIARSLDSLS
jgi:hypothetical protein